MGRIGRIAIAGAIGLLLPLSSAIAQQQQTQRIRGTIEKADGNVLALKSSDGSALKLTLVPNARVVAVIKATMADIKPGTFLGSAAMPQPDGSQKALEVHIFPEEMRGTGEGHRPCNTPNSTMTNGTAAGATVSGVDGSAMIVTYKGGEQKIVVPPGVPIVRYAIGSSSDLKSGAPFHRAEGREKARRHVRSGPHQRRPRRRGAAVAPTARGSRIDLTPTPITRRSRAFAELCPPAPPGSGRILALACGS